MAQNLENYLPGIRENGLITNEAITTASTINGLQSVINVNATNGTSPTLTVAQSGSVVLWNATTGSLVTLPPPAVGLYYNFVVATAATTGSHAVKTDASATSLVGGVPITSPASGGTGATFFANGTNLLSARFNGTTTGGSPGTFINVVAISTTQWAISGSAYGSGVLVTPFSTS